jgi:uncharacterized protein YecE (DUF72 family)
MPAWVGTSGWQYRDWRSRFYPDGVPQKAWLEYYVTRFPTVELNNAFYRLPEKSTFEQWRARTPAGFVMTVKASRYLTHIKRLKEPEEPVARLMDRAAGLGDRLGPVLIQLPPTLRADADALDACLRCFPSGVRLAVEPRHESWWTDDVRAVLEKHGAALSWADRLGRPVTPRWRTTNWGYLRLHEGRANPRPRYGRQALSTWAERLASTFKASEDVFVYLNNDPGGAAIIDADTISGALSRRGVPVVEPRM